MEDTESALRDGDVHDVFGADADGGARVRQNDELISVNRTLVLDWVSSYLRGKKKIIGLISIALNLRFVK